MKRLIIRLALFFTPLALIYIGLFALAIHVGEATPPDRVMEMQLGDTPVLYGVIDSNMQYAYKLMNLRARQPRVLVLGSSRSMEMRAAFFNVPTSEFYNASVNSAELDTFLNFLSETDTAQPPELVLWALDQPLLIEPLLETPLPAESVYLTYDFEDSLRGFEHTVQALFAQRVNLGALLERRDPVDGDLALGVEAIRVARGLRNDGSTQNGALLLNRNIAQDGLNQHREDFEARSGRYTPADSLQAENLARVEAVLALARERGIALVGYSAPFHPDIYAAMQASGEFGYLDAVEPALRELFARYGFHYVDFADPARLNLTAEDFWDGWHSSERASLRMVIALAEDVPATFDPFVDLAALRTADANAVDTFQVFD